MSEMDGVLDGVVWREAELGAAGCELVGGAFEKFGDGVPIAATDAVDVTGERLVVQRDARVIVRIADEALGLPEDLAIKKCGTFGADGDDADVLAHDEEDRECKA